MGTGILYGEYRQDETSVSVPSPEPPTTTATATATAQWWEELFDRIDTLEAAQRELHALIGGVGQALCGEGPELGPHPPAVHPSAVWNGPESAAGGTGTGTGTADGGAAAAGTTAGVPAPPPGYVAFQIPAPPTGYSIVHAGLARSTPAMTAPPAHRRVIGGPDGSTFSTSTATTEDDAALTPPPIVPDFFGRSLRRN